MIVVGLTGGIGAGKSTVASLLGRRGALVIDADQVARQVAAPGGPAHDALVRHFGPSVVLADATLDRAAIAARVFSDPAELAALNAITHPAIAVQIARLVADQAATNRIVVLDLPLLVEAMRSQFGLAGVVVVEAPIEVAIDRLVRFRGLSEGDARARVGSQIGPAERRRLADRVIDNRGSLQDLDASMSAVWAWMQGLGDDSSVDRPLEEALDPDPAEAGQEDH